MLGPQRLFLVCVEDRAAQMLLSSAFEQCALVDDAATRHVHHDRPLRKPRQLTPPIMPVVSSVSGVCTVRTADCSRSDVERR